jgi:hypothetical protein
MDESMVADVLVSLKDVPGIQGSFVIDAFGRVLARDLPALFPDFSLQSAGQRIAVLFDAIEENYEGSDEVFLAFDGYGLMLRRGAFGTLAVVAAAGTSPEALRMSSSVLTRRLTMLHAQPPMPAPAMSGGTLREAGYGGHRPPHQTGQQTGAQPVPAHLRGTGGQGVPDFRRTGANGPPGSAPRGPNSVQRPPASTPGRAPASVGRPPASAPGPFSGNPGSRPGAPPSSGARTPGAQPAAGGPPPKKKNDIWG